MSTNANVGKIIQSSAWFTKYAPQRFEEIVFPDVTKYNQIKEVIDNGFISGNILSFGPHGVGKTTINNIIIKSIIQHPNDLMVMDRSLKNIDEELKPWLRKPAIKSKQKICVLEEFDQLSSQAMTVLKNGLMENFQPKVAFIATTNKVRKIDPALLDRFNIKLDFIDIDVVGAFNRLKYILGCEGIQYNEEDLKTFINNQPKAGMRTLINNLQLSCITGSLVLNSNTNIGDSNNEDYIVQFVSFLVNYLLNYKDLNGVYNILVNAKNDQDFFKNYDILLKYLEQNSNINIEMVFDGLLKEENLQGLAINNVIKSYYQKIYQFNYPDLAILSLIGDLSKTIYELKGGLNISRDVPLIC